MKVLCLFFAFVVIANAQQLVNSITVMADTSQVKTVPGVLNSAGTVYSGNMFVIPNGGMYDIYDRFAGKTASIPINKQPANLFVIVAYVLNVDNSWQLLYINNDTSGYGITGKTKYRCNLYSGTSKTLTDSSLLSPLFAGGNCYLYSSPSSSGGSFTYNIWKLGAAGSVSPMSMKSAVLMQPEAIMLQGGLKIQTHNISGSTTLVQIFDLAGRLAYSEAIPNDKPTLIPSNSLPNSPFVTEIGGIMGNLFIKGR